MRSARSSRRARLGTELASTSTSSEPPERLAIARVLGPHGVRGELACALLTDYPERFRRTREVLVRDGQDRHRVLASRLSGDRVYLRLDGIADRTAAEALRGAILEVPLAEAVALPPDTYFWHQLVGLRVQTEAGEPLGVVVEVLPTGGNDVYVVRGEAREILLPAIRDVVREVDLERGVMIVSLLPGLAS